MRMEYPFSASTNLCGALIRRPRWLSFNSDGWFGGLLPATAFTIFVPNGTQNKSIFIED